MNKVNEIKESMQELANPQKAQFMYKYFKAGKGEYGEGDLFLGLSVPEQRQIAKEFYKKVEFDQLQILLDSPIHEHRLTAIFILVLQYEKSKDDCFRDNLVAFYLRNTQKMNNWDLVDSGCYKIIGHYAFHHQKEKIIFNLANSDSLWEKRIAVVSTLYFIKKNSLDLPFEIIQENLFHSHDLMHKANGWMLREIGEKDEAKLKDFLDEYAPKLPRTTLRYAIEKLDPILRKYYMDLKE
jgi:3-methyladenine DNA glycosylase AlkD